MCLKGCEERREDEDRRRGEGGGKRQAQRLSRLVESSRTGDDAADPMGSRAAAMAGVVADLLCPELGYLRAVERPYNAQFTEIASRVPAADGSSAQIEANLT